MMWWDDSYGYAGWWMMTGMAVLWLLVIVTVVAVLLHTISTWRAGQARNDSARASTPRSSALPNARGILDDRYARGDISTEEYLERSTHLPD